MKRELSLFLLLCFFFKGAYATDEIYEIGAPSSVRFVYLPFSGSSFHEPFRLEIKSKTLALIDQSNNAKRLKLVVRPSNFNIFSASKGQQKIPIEIVANHANPLRKVNSEYHQNLRLQTNHKLSIDYILSAPPSIWLAPGIYELELDLELIDEKNRIVATKELVVEVLVEPRLQMSIVGSLTNHYQKGVSVSVMDFGVLQTGESQQIFLQIRGNVPARIHLSSENSGKMRQQENSNFTVDYTVNLDGQEHSLLTPVSIARDIERSLHGTKFPMRVVIGDVAGKFSGVYRDIIYVDISPQ